MTNLLIASLSGNNCVLLQKTSSEYEENKPACNTSISDFIILFHLDAIRGSL